MKYAVALLAMLPFTVLAGHQSPASGELARAAAEIAAPHWAKVVFRKSAVGSDNMGMLIPERLCFATTGDVSAEGLRLLEQAGGFARQTNKKLYLQVSGNNPESELRGIARILPESYIQANALLGNHVYLYTKDE